MRVYHFLNKEYGLEGLRKRRIKISILSELNDPFELMSANLSNRIFRQALERTKARLSKKNGLLCFSKSWRNPVLWSHYAEKHKGICLGFDVPDAQIKKVQYVKSRVKCPSIIDEIFMSKLLFTKFSHWAYEDEYRVYTTLEDPINGIYYAGFSETLKLAQVIVGSESDITRSEIASALGSLSENVTRFKARPAFTSFNIVKNKNDILWL